MAGGGNIVTKYLVNRGMVMRGENVATKALYIYPCHSERSEESFAILGRDSSVVALPQNDASPSPNRRGLGRGLGRGVDLNICIKQIAP